jgi:CRP-like cAMP-binding protein
MNTVRGQIQIKPLRDLELFAGCTNAQLRQIRSLTTLLQLTDGTALTREGQNPRQLMIIGGGKARLTRMTDNGIAQVADLGTGSFLGAVELLSGTPFTTTATALTDLAVYVSTVSEFRSILEIAPSVERKIWQMVERSVWETMDDAITQPSGLRHDGIHVAA